MKILSEKLGARGFTRDYWDVNYQDADEMDNIVNAKEHAHYLKAILELEYIDVSSVVDLGFGLGVLFKEVLKTFKPYRALGIEPSSYAFELVSKKKLTNVESIKLKLEKIDLLTWAQRKNKREETFDLGLCTSVFQYLSDAEIEKILPTLSKRVRYLYFSVPTDLELKRQIEEVNFKDEYAIHRTKKVYVEMLQPHFAFVSSRLLESRFHFNEDNTNFSDLLFRF